MECSSVASLSPWAGANAGQISNYYWTSKFRWPNSKKVNIYIYTYIIYIYTYIIYILYILYIYIMYILYYTQKKKEDKEAKKPRKVEKVVPIPSMTESQQRL